ncbi:hypothetical protein [Streptomyces sp. H27-D2]|uniref:hypothetical protein n=1 Tax=Streptomyces sp. H27-D2 TaxID=3046304 RepID=UPI002DBB7895|nr:hypothetical protein [Streptomyces sp. H27-D2]MEC4020951.1 hypothetical protein [Streptomyces sp. H27-D2]
MKTAARPLSLLSHPSRGPVLGWLLALVAVVAAALLALSAAPASGAQSATGPQAVADALRKGPVYVDPRVSGELSAADAKALAEKIKDADKPIFVAVLPDTKEFPPGTLLQDVRNNVGISGLYAVHLGDDGFNAGADARVMPGNAVRNLTGAVKRADSGDTDALLSDFVDQASKQAKGRAPDAWAGGSNGDGGGAGAAIALGAVVVVGGGGAYAVLRRNRKQRAEQEQAALEAMRPLVDEDITAFGEELDRIGFQPAEPSADDAMREDYGHALDAYDRAKAAMAAAGGPEDVRAVTAALEDGRFSLATLDARREGAPLPERRAPCFFDPRHGPSVADARWAPEGGAERDVPVCAADAARIADGEEPLTRTVQTSQGERPYWNAGPAYGPWAGGYFGGGMLPGLLVGTMLGSALSSPGAYAGDMPDGGDYTGSDFNPDDFGGGFGGDGGGFGGGGGGGFDGGGGF